MQGCFVWQKSNSYEEVIKSRGTMPPVPMPMPDQNNLHINNIKELQLDVIQFKDCIIL